MNNWFRSQLENILYNTTLKESDIAQLLANITNMMLIRRYAVAPLFLSDEMYASIKEHCPFLGYNEANKIYTSAIEGYLKE